MAKLFLVFKKKVIKDYPFANDHITIGRNPDNDVTIDNLAVSGHHARIDKSDAAFILTDLQSTNGTYVNNKRIVSHRLQHKDSIRIGKHLLVFALSEKEIQEVQKACEMAGMNQTRILDTAQQREILAEERQIKGSRAAASSEKIGVLTSLDNSGVGDFELRKKLNRIGKAPNSEVRLSGLKMPATAATISRRPNGYVITLLGGNIKVKTNGKLLQGSEPLKDFDTIEIGSYKFQFYQKDSE
jgi:pSer/pThr/pTyr-binding forkhead associated (FHA) protein